MAKRNPREKFHKATLKFALAQLDAGEMSLQMLSGADNPRRIQTCKQDARKRFDRAVRALRAISPNPAEERIDEKMHGLQSKLVDLGEDFPDAEIAWDCGAEQADESDSQRESAVLEMHRQFEQTLFDFVSNEIQLATTFANMARSASDPDRRDRSAENASKAYRTARDFMANTLLTEDKRSELKAQLKPLEQTLKGFGSTDSGEGGSAWFLK
ncbi:MAG TPA: hypothetical protein VG322_04555 [Candidatus Acidoferrales bacterium]|jgi:hypothetical protein|nr:hypothetical protein [Candidatus Acidoferrales bacterium]